MSDFIVSARKYRPKDFDSVVGQSSITSTLKNAIKSDQLAQSYLFCGPRGVGKTTCARIFAKEINQFNNENDIDDFSFNIFELDAASNNSVDDIRNLTDQVRVPPQAGRYKVYIIDEVHMLSVSAFNAFLKTLEEPPKYAKFVLATTEKSKIIPTILSRCQIFDFKRVSVDDISDHLDFVAKSEGIIAEKDALHLIAQKADGAMRDALSLFDRLISFSDNNLTYKSVVEHLNILDYDYYFRITEALLKNDIKQLLNLYNEILESGFDGHHFINGLSSHLRDILVSKDKITIKLLEKGESLESRYLDQSQRCELKFLLTALNLCNECDIQYKTTNNQRLLVELTLMRISSINFDADQKKKI
jgi:DNA polymerase-3 subunit gamma/tau